MLSDSKYGEIRLMRVNEAVAKVNMRTIRLGPSAARIYCEKYQLELPAEEASLSQCSCFVQGIRNNSLTWLQFSV